MHNPKQKWNHLNPKIGEKYKSISQQKICIVTFVVANVYPIRFEKCETIMLIVTCGRSIDKKMPFSSVYFMDVQWEIFTDKFNKWEAHMFNEVGVCGPYLPIMVAQHLAKELLLNPTLKLKQMWEVIIKNFKCSVSKGKYDMDKERDLVMIDGKICDHYA